MSNEFETTWNEGETAKAPPASEQLAAERAAEAAKADAEYAAAWGGADDVKKDGAQ
jgi:hypothetical protein